jgi:enoyl-CoA hydratase/carnithine racemase
LIVEPPTLEPPVSGLARHACEGLLAHEDHGVLVVTLARPAKRNAVTLAMYRAMRDLFTEAAALPRIRSILLRGSSGIFSAGADIGDLARGEDRKASLVEHRLISDAAVTALADCPKPSVALIEGICLGGGLSFAMACDFRIATPDSSFAIPAARLGVVYSLSDCQRLHALVGLQAARRMLYLGDRMDAAEALRVGLADEVAADAPARAEALLAALAERAPLSIAGSKITLDALAASDAAGRATAIAAAVSRAMDSHDLKEATAAFLEKRRPVFTGS